MKKRIVIAMVTGLIIASLAGCGTKTEATDQEVPESSAVESVDETEETATDEITSTEVIGDDTEEIGEVVGAENEIIEFAAEKGSQDAPELVGMAFEPYDGIIDATDKLVPVFDEEGYFVGNIKMGVTVDATAMGNGWVQFENPVEGTEYDYLYAGAYCLAPNTISAAEMAQHIQDYINTYSIQDVEYTFVNEATPDMEVYEFRMNSVYDDQTTLDYWINQMISVENTDVLQYETLYIECEEDTDGWIICRIYYKDKMEFEN